MRVVLVHYCIVGLKLQGDTCMYLGNDHFHHIRGSQSWWAKAEEHRIYADIICFWEVGPNSPSKLSLCRTNCWHRCGSLFEARECHSHPHAQSACNSLQLWNTRFHFGNATGLCTVKHASIFKLRFAEQPSWRHDPRSIQFVFCIQWHMRIQSLGSDQIIRLGHLKEIG